MSLINVMIKDEDGLTIEEERLQRVKSFRDVMKSIQLDLAVVQCMEDCYWLTGFNTPGAPRCQALIVTQNDLLISSRTLEVTNALIHPSLSASSGHREGEDPVRHLVNNIVKFHPQIVGIQLDNERTTPADAQELQLILKENNYSIVDIQGIIRSMRSVKSRRELSLMRRAGEICAQSIHEAIQHTKENIHCSESDVAAFALLGGRRGGGDYAAYPPFISAGYNAQLGHYASSKVNVPLRNGENIFYELAGCFQRYHVALMRTAHIGTHLTPKMQVRFLFLFCYTFGGELPFLVIIDNLES